MLRDLLPDTADGDRAVSPVIGVILMVAITVILATVIGAIVLDFGNNAGNDSPSASLSVEADSGSPGDITIEHTGGDSLDLSETRILIDDTSGSQAEFKDGSGTFAVGDTGSLADDGTLSGDFSGTFTTTSSFALSSGGEVTVTIIDTDSQRQIYETTVTVG